MVNSVDELGLTEIENKKIAALHAGATPEEASLHGKLPRIAAAEQGRFEEEEEEELFLADVVNEEVQTDSLADIVNNAEPAYSQSQLKKDSLELAVLRLEENPNMFPDLAYKEAMQDLRSSSNKQEVFERYQNTYSSNKKEDIYAAALNAAISQTSSPEQTATTIESLNSLEEEYSGEAGKEKLFVDTLANPELSLEELDHTAATNYADSLSNEWADSVGFGDKAVSFLSLILVPDFFKDAADLTGGGILNTRSKVEALIRGYNLQSPQQKMDSFPGLLEDLKVAYDNNPFKVMRFVGMLHSIDAREDFNIGTVEDAFDIGTSATLAAAFKLGSNMVKGRQLQSKLKDIEANEKAAILNEIKKKDDPDAPVEQAAGSEIDEAITSSAYDFEDHIIGLGSTDGLAPHVQRQREALIEALPEAIDETVRAPFILAKRTNERLQIESLKTVEKDARVTEETRLLMEMAEENPDQIIKNIKEVKRTESGFMLQYDTIVDGKVTTKPHVVHWRDTDAGDFIGENKDFIEKNFLFNNLVSSKVFSPKVKLLHVDNTILDNTTMGGLQADVLKKQLTTIAKDIDKGFSRKQRLKVNSLLIHGDEKGRVFTVAELLSGIDSKRGREVFTPDEIKNYFNKIAFNRELKDFRDHSLREALMFQGTKEINYIKGGQVTKMLGAPKSKLSQVSIDANEQILAPQLAENGYLKASDVSLKEKYDEDYVAVKLTQEYKVDGEKVRWALMKDEGEEGLTTFKQLPQKVLADTGDHYVPRIYEPGYYFVKDINTGHTLRAFSSKAQADRWKDKKQLELDKEFEEITEARKTDGIIAKPVRQNLQSFADRELSKLDALIEDANAYGGLYTGARKKQPLLLDEKGDKLKRLSWGDALQRNIDSISEDMPLNRYKLSLKERWINTVNQIAKNENKPAIIRPGAEDWKTTKLEGLDGTTRQMLLDSRDYMLDQFRVWSQEERLWNKFMTSIIETTGLEGKYARFFMKNVAQKSPLDVMHGLAFNLHMGWFNPRQLYVQAQNATLAISMHPVEGLKAATKAAHMRTLIYAQDSQIDGLAKMLSKDGAGQLAEDVRLFNRTGLKDSILRIADSDTAIEGIGAGHRQAAKNWSKKGLVFYENGELFSRMTAFNIALSKWRKANKGKKITDTDLKGITSDTFRMHMNLQRENAASWQKTPLLKNATQFQQVQAKLIENMMLSFTKKEGTWTKTEAASVLAGQVAIYGTLGVPIAQGVSEYLIDASGTDPVTFQKENPQLAELVADGINGWMFGLMGFQNQLGGTTASLVASLDENVAVGVIKQALATEPYNQDTVGELAFGAGVNVASRGKDAFLNAWDSIRIFTKTPTAEAAADGLIKFGDDFLAMSSTWSNARKARWVHYNNKVWTKSGKVILNEKDLQGVNFRSKILMAMGLPLDVEQSYWELSKQNRERSQDMAEVKKDLRLAINQALKDDGNLARYNALEALLLGGGQWSEQEIREMKKDVFNTILDGEDKSALSKEIKKQLMQLIRSGGKFPASIALSNIHEARTAPEEEEK